MKDDSKIKKILGYILKTLHILILAFASVSFFAGIYTHSIYPNEKFDEIYFYIVKNVDGDGKEAILGGIATMIIPTLLLFALLVFLQYSFFGKKIIITKKKKDGTEKKIQLLPLIKRVWIKVLFTAVASLLLIAYGLQAVGCFEFYLARSESTEFIEKNYQNPADSNYIFNQKRNLIVIELESMETTLFSKEHGGEFDYEPIAELYDLLDEGIYFSSDDGTRGARDLYGTTWTTAAIVSYTSGLPFKVPSDLNNAYHSENFMNGAYTLGDVLHDNGYQNYLISGARTSFGGVSDYFERHGDYDIIDTNSADDYGYFVPISQENEWGFSDETSFAIARELLTRKINDGSAPLHLFISTIDTHFTGYVYEADDKNGMTGSETRFERQIDNAYATTSRETYYFVRWLMEQDYYDNTTVVIIGDHTNMSRYFFPNEISLHRGRYNLILNSQATTEDTKNRIFTSVDFYPTILAAMGVEFDGESLGLGVNLFSGKKTLAEKYTLAEMTTQCEKNSDFYNDFILGDDWEMLVQKQKEYEEEE